MNNRVNSNPVTTACRGFTLIELLVVISIIALLIGILLPALGKAREISKQALDMANSRSNGQAIMTYTADNKATYMTAYQYRASNDFNEKSIGATSATGYLQWSGVLIQGGYFNAGKGSVSPNHEFGGWAPTHFNDGTTITTANAPNLGKDEGAIQNGQIVPPAETGILDTQSPRLSYVPNCALIPRLKTPSLQGGNLKLVKVDEVEKQSDTVLLGTYTKYVRALAKTSVSGGAALKTHRPFLAVKTAAGADYNAESPATGATDTDLRAVTWDDAVAACDLAKAGGDCTAANSINFLSLDNYGEAGSAYTFADGHGAMMRYNADLFDPTSWKWGVRMYSQKNRPLITTDGTNPVQ